MSAWRVEQVLLQGERAHAVAEQDERDAGMLGPCPCRQRRHVVDEAVPAGGAEIALPFDGAGGASVAAVVVGVHDVPGVDQRLAETPVPGRVLAHPVSELDDGLRGAVAGPAVDEHLLAVGALDRERRLFHRAGE